MPKAKTSEESKSMSKPGENAQQGDPKPKRPYYPSQRQNTYKYKSQPRQRLVKDAAWRALKRHQIFCNDEVEKTKIWFMTTSFGRPDNLRQYVWQAANTDTWTNQDVKTFDRTMNSTKEGRTNPTRWGMTDNIHLAEMINAGKVIPVAVSNGSNMPVAPILAHQVAPVATSSENDNSNALTTTDVDMDTGIVDMMPGPVLEDASVNDFQYYQEFVQSMPTMPAYDPYLYDYQLGYPHAGQYDSFPDVATSQQAVTQNNQKLLDEDPAIFYPYLDLSGWTSHH